MGDEALNPAQQAEYRFLKNEVNKYEREANRTNFHPNVQHDLWRAREELKKFVSDLRQAGVKI